MSLPKEPKLMLERRVMEVMGFSWVCCVGEVLYSGSCFVGQADSFKAG
ncbi:hypothetical protein [Myxococcus phage Mx1]|nr:hypothetical protein [Myxococcus phage Mx1]